MNKNKQGSFSKEKLISKSIFAIVMATAFALVFGPAIQAHFYRITGDSGWGYGYGYGYGSGYGTNDGSYRSAWSAADVYEYNYGYGSLISAPSITTSAASSVVSSSATLNGNITATGDNAPTARGFQYGLTTSYGSTAASSGSSFGTGAYSENISGLTCGGTTYHFRAYATNFVGTTYGSDATFSSAGCGGGGGSAYIPPVAPPVVPPVVEEDVTEEEVTQEEVVVENIAADAPVTTDGTVAVDPSKGGQTTLTTTTGAKVKITVPKNAVAANTTVNISEIAASAIQASAPAPSGKSIVGSAFSMQAVQGAVAVGAFQKDISLTFTYTDAQITGLSESSLKVYYWNNTQWIAIPTTVNTATNTITSTVDHFTYFAIMGTPQTVAETTPTILAYTNGSLLKVKGNPTIWLIEDSLKKGIPQAGIFESKFRWQDIIEILSSSTLDSYETGDNLKYPDGTLIMGSDKTVYAVSDNGKKRGFTSAAIFTTLSYKWENIIAIADSELARYAAGTLINSATIHPAGALINNNGTIFQIDSTNKLRGIPTPNVFATNRLDWNNVVTATTQDKTLTIGANLSFPDGTIIREKGKATVYIVADQKKRGFTSANIFTSKGYKWDNIIEATQEEVATLTDGEVLE